jgi:hypothetical protein
MLKSSLGKLCCYSIQKLKDGLYFSLKVEKLEGFIDLSSSYSKPVGPSSFEFLTKLL